MFNKRDLHTLLVWDVAFPTEKKHWVWPLPREIHHKTDGTASERLEFTMVTEARCFTLPYKECCIHVVLKKKKKRAEMSKLKNNSEGQFPYKTNLAELT